MIFIDWISPAGHVSFNRNLIGALDLGQVRIIVFSEQLAMEDQDCTVLPNRGGRFRRAFDVLRICRRLRKEAIVFLSFDPLFGPLIQLLCRNVYVVEHNTTPEREGRYWRHAIWQRLTYFRIHRLAQFPGQHETLKRLGQKSHFMGSPLSKIAKEVKRPSPTLFITPSDRVNAEELLTAVPIVRNSEVLIRRSALTPDDMALVSKSMRLRVVDWIDFDKCAEETIAIIITIRSSIRGSGWFNEAIEHGIPLIITNSNVQDMFSLTFPGYPFLAPNRMKKSSQASSDLAVSVPDRTARQQFSDANNAILKERFLTAVRQS